MIQKLQKIRNIRRAKEIKKQNIPFYDNNSNIEKMDESIEELSQIINSVNEKKKIKKKSKNKKKITTESRTIPSRYNNTVLNKLSTSQSNTLSIINQRNRLFKNNLSNICNYTEKNKRLLKINCEPYSNVYEYFNNTKLDMKSLIYIR